MAPVASHSLIKSVVLNSAPHLFIPGGRASRALQCVFMYSYCLARYWCWEQLYVQWWDPWTVTNSIWGTCASELELAVGGIAQKILRGRVVPSYGCGGEESGVTLRRWRLGWVALSSSLYLQGCVFVSVCVGVHAHFFCISEASWGVVLVKVIREDVWR